VDSRQRELYRSAGEGDPEARAAELGARWRAGELTREEVELLDYLGEPVAELIDAPPDARRWPEELRELRTLSVTPASGRFRLERWPEACMRALWIATRVALAAVELGPEERAALTHVHALCEGGRRAEGADVEAQVRGIYEESGSLARRAIAALFTLLPVSLLRRHDPREGAAIALTGFEAALGAAGVEAVEGVVRRELIAWVLAGPASGRDGGGVSGST